jgi:hypothetical protein
MFLSGSNKCLMYGCAKSNHIIGLSVGIIGIIGIIGFLNKDWIVHQWKLFVRGNLNKCISEVDKSDESEVDDTSEKWVE